VSVYASTDISRFVSTRHAPYLVHTPYGHSYHIFPIYDSTSSIYCIACGLAIITQLLFSKLLSLILFYFKEIPSYLFLLPQCARLSCHSSLINSSHRFHFTSASTPTLHNTLPPTLEKLHAAWEKASHKDHYSHFVPALDAGKAKLDTYYQRSAQSDAHIMAMGKFIYHSCNVLTRPSPSSPQCSVCHTRFPDEGDDVWRPDLCRYGDAL
jgi:hypothetical protein